eukprot:6192190-Pleurochrysis_carterae.AAC.7
MASVRGLRPRVVSSRPPALFASRAFLLALPRFCSAGLLRLRDVLLVRSRESSCSLEPSTPLSRFASLLTLALALTSSRYLPLSVSVSLALSRSHAPSPSLSLARSLGFWCSCSPCVSLRCIALLVRRRVPRAQVDCGGSPRALQLSAARCPISAAAPPPQNGRTHRGWQPTPLAHPEHAVRRAPVWRSRAAAEDPPVVPGLSPGRRRHLSPVHGVYARGAPCSRQPALPGQEQPTG